MGGRGQTTREGLKKGVIRCGRGTLSGNVADSTVLPYKSKVRARVEHVFGVIKRVFGFQNLFICSPYSDVPWHTIPFIQGDSE